MKRLALLALLLAPASFQALADAPSAPTPPQAPVVTIAPGVEACDDQCPASLECAKASDPPTPPKAAWFRELGTDAASQQFRNGFAVRVVQPVRRTIARVLAAAPTKDRSKFTPVEGPSMGTPERARKEARRTLERVVAEWLGPEVPRSWKAPAPMLDALVVGPAEIKEIEGTHDGKVFGTLYRATLPCDLSSVQRARLMKVYETSVVARRLTMLGIVIGFVLTCLAILAGYIRMDEATKGFYTKRLRVAALAGVGVAGAVAHRLLT